MTMQKEISKYISLLLVAGCSFFLISLPVTAQQKKIMKSDLEKELKKQQPFYRGSALSVDIFGLGNKLFGGDFLSSEINFTVNLKNRFLPVIEIGYGQTDTTDEDNGIHYKSSGPYGRIGVNYNTMFKKDSPNYIYVGIRYGYSTFKYDIQSPDISDPIWGGEVPFSYTGLSSSAGWFEFLVGINVQIYKNFQMGWAVRYKAKMKAKENLHADPWYLPGFGTNHSTNFGFTYSLIYKLPF